MQAIFVPMSDQETLDEFITRQHPTSICDVEYYIRMYDRRQYL
jgi:hypothetical protein